MTLQIRRTLNRVIFGFDTSACIRSGSRIGVTETGRSLRTYSQPQANGSSSPVGNLPLSVPVGSERGLSPELIVGTFAQVTSQSVQDSSHWQAQRYPIRVVVTGRRTAIRVSAVTTQFQSPLSKFVLRVVGFLVATHVFNHMSGVSQRAGKDNQDRGYFSQAKNGRNSNVRR